MSTSSVELGPADSCGLEQIRRAGGPTAVPWKVCCAFGLVAGESTCVLGEPPGLATSDDIVDAATESLAAVESLLAVES